MATRIATVIGNGESRIGLDINTLKTIGMTVGCNAVHRDMQPDYLVCADKKMVFEVLKDKDNKVPYPHYTRAGWLDSFKTHQKTLRHLIFFRCSVPILFENSFPLRAIEVYTHQLKLLSIKVNS